MSTPANQTGTSQQLIDKDEPDTVRLSVDEARAIGETAVQRIGYTAEDAHIVVDQLVDNMLCGYEFAGLPRILAMAGDEKIKLGRTLINKSRALLNFLRFDFPSTSRNSRITLG